MKLTNSIALPLKVFLSFFKARKNNLTMTPEDSVHPHPASLHPISMSSAPHQATTAPFHISAAYAAPRKTPSFPVHSPKKNTAGETVCTYRSQNIDAPPYAKYEFRHIRTVEAHRSHGSAPSTGGHASSLSGSASDLDGMIKLERYKGFDFS